MVWLYKILTTLEKKLYNNINKLEYAGANDINNMVALQYQTSDMDLEVYLKKDNFYAVTKKGLDKSTILKKIEYTKLFPFFDNRTPLEREIELADWVKEMIVNRFLYNIRTDTMGIRNEDDLIIAYKAGKFVLPIYFQLYIRPTDEGYKEIRELLEKNGLKRGKYRVIPMPLLKFLKERE